MSRANNLHIMRTFLIIIASLFAYYALAQEANNDLGVISGPHPYRITSFAIGQTKRLDTYLSPEEYKGTDLRFISDYHTKPKGKWNLELEFTHEGAFDYTHNRSKNGKTLAGHYNFAFSTLKDILPRQKQYGIKVGAMTDLYTGFAYNMHNGANNPAQGYASLSIGGAISARYNLFSIGNTSFTLVYDARIPMAGIMFSPAYGQSYYELFNNGDYDNNIVFTSIAVPQLRHTMAIEIPINHKMDLRVGYLGDYRQSKPNNLKQHIYTHSFLIGLKIWK